MGQQLNHRTVHEALRHGCWHKSESFTFPLEVAVDALNEHGSRVAKDIFGSKELKMMLEVTQKVLRENGFRGLYAGLAPSVLEVLPSAALGYYC